MSFILPGAALAGLVGLVVLVLALRGRPVEGLRLGPLAFKFTTPVDVGGAATRVPLAILGVAIIVAAGLIAFGGVTGGGGLGQEPETVAIDDVAGFNEAEDSGAVTITMRAPDTMAAWTVAEDIGAFSLAVDAEVVAGPDNSVACVAFRMSGRDLAPGGSVRSPGAEGWPKNGYTYCLSPTGEWAMTRWDDGTPVAVSDFSTSIAINSDGANSLRVRSEGDRHSLYINDLAQDETTDDAYEAGAVQLVCGTPAEVPGEANAVCKFTAIGLEDLD